MGQNARMRRDLAQPVASPNVPGSGLARASSVIATDVTNRVVIRVSSEALRYPHPDACGISQYHIESPRPQMKHRPTYDEAEQSTDGEQE